MLTGCDVTEDDRCRKSCARYRRGTTASRKRCSGRNHLAPTFSPSQVVKPPRFNAYYRIEDVKPIDGATWQLELAGLIADKRPWTAQQIYQLPAQEIIISHVCVEGWDYIGQWSGPNLRAFFERVGADLTAKYVYFIAPTTIPKASIWRPRCIRRPSSPPNMPAT